MSIPLRPISDLGTLDPADLENAKFHLIHGGINYQLDYTTLRDSLRTSLNIQELIDKADEIQTCEEAATS